ncbi:MAG: hypothetical protein KJ011_01910 [Burkholderiaceae bacterium]|nr:hypothetical protein [Burkholderiaceae bacterium]
MPPDRHPLASPCHTLVGAALFVGLCASPPAQAAPGRADALRVQRAEIIDARGFEKPMVAATLMVPAGWKHDGDVRWSVGRQCGKPYGLRLQASAPDGSDAIELALPEAWGATNHGSPLGDCPQAGFRNAREYLSSWIGRHRKGARLVEYKPRPDKSQMPAQNQWSGGSLRSWVDSGQALIAYRQGEREMHELLVTNVAFSQTRLAGLNGQVLESLQGHALGVLGWRSASGPVPQRHFDLMWATLKTAPEWQARINAAEQQMAAENAATQAQISRMQAESSRETLAHIKRRGEIRNEAMQETARMRNETWRAGQATQDRMHKDTVRTIRGVQGYRDPRSGGVVELPQHYDHAWQLRDGSYVLTDDPNFDPRRDVGVAGEKLQRTRE